MKLSVVIPVHNEEKCIKKISESLLAELTMQKIDHELILVNDNSTDASLQVLGDLARNHNCVRIINSSAAKGFGQAIRIGLDNIQAEAVVIFMGDGSDSPSDVTKYYNKLLEGYDCVFGSRFIKGSKVIGYPMVKLVLNRLGNLFIQLIFWVNYNDVSNAFKAYRAHVIKSVQPLVSQYFNITVEIPLKAIIRKFSYIVVPIDWSGRHSGVSKYNIKELSRKYFFSIIFVWLEKMLLKDEIRKNIQ